jgi:hypothetical protein
MTKRVCINKFINELLTNKLEKYNKLSIDYYIESIEYMHNLLIQIKTIFGVDYNLMQVRKSVDNKRNIVIVNKKSVNCNLFNNPVENIFHTYNENSGFILYDKYKHIINNIISINSGRVIIVEKNESVQISESYNANVIYNYLEYEFLLKNGLVISIEHYFTGREHYRLKVTIPIKEDKYISVDKVEYINNICSKVDILVN